MEPFRVMPPPNRNAVEQLLTLQDAISQVEALIQAGNIILLKIRAVLFAVIPQVQKDSEVIFRLNICLHINLCNIQRD